MKFIPVRGRKHGKTVADVEQDVEIYPREGTETFNIFTMPFISPLKFIPVRGRKLVSLLHEDITPPRG